MTAQEAKVLRTAPLATPTDLTPNAVRDLAGALNILLADMFGLYLKTKNFHWHVSGPHFRDYHLLLDEQGEQIFATTDACASSCPAARTQADNRSWQFRDEATSNRS
jgi:starvation-inducible DNA-binding protein